MTDREMLEAAAKATGWAFVFHEEGPYLLGPDSSDYWNPLDDDALALRLAVRVGIDVQQFIDHAMVEAWKHPHQACGEDYGADPYAATRRAVVRAAAKIGRKMP